MVAKKHFKGTILFPGHNKILGGTGPNTHPVVTGLPEMRFVAAANRAGLKPMQPMQPHWAPRLWSPAPWCFGGLFIFARCTLRLRIQYNCQINFIVNKERSRQTQ